MAKKIVWSKRANARFNKIIKDIEEDWGEKAAIDFVNKSYFIIELLTEHSNIGRIENPSKNIRGILISKQTRLFYRYKKKDLILLAFFDTRSGGKLKNY